MQPSRCFLLSLLLAEFGAVVSIPVTSFNFKEPGFSANITISPNSNIPVPLNVSNDQDHIRLNDTIYIAALATLNSHPNAKFLEVQATPVDPPTADPSLLTDIKLIFGLGAQTIYVEMMEWGVWMRPRLVKKEPPTGLGALPLDIRLDLPAADELIKQAGYDQEYDAVDIKWPTDIPVSRQQAYYIFSMVGPGPWEIAVGVEDHTVKAADSVLNGDDPLNGKGSSIT